MDRISKVATSCTLKEIVQKLNNEELEGRVINPLHAENDAQKSGRIGMGQVVQVYANICITEK